MFKTISAKNKLISLCKTVGLCLMSVSLCLSAIFSAPRKVAFASGAGVSQVGELNQSDVVTFGEYPQDPVIKVTEWEKHTKVWISGGAESQAKITVPKTVKSNSVKVHTEVKSKIENLIKTYYSTSHTVGGETTPVKENYDWHNSTVGYFAPKEDFANDEISYDHSTGYYTLLKSVSAGDFGYSAGSKFYPYNRLVDNVNKYYSVDVSPDAPKGDRSMAGKFVYLDSCRDDGANRPQPGVNPNEASIKFSPIKDLSNMYMLRRNEEVYGGEISDVNYVVVLHGYDRFLNSDTAPYDEDCVETGTGPDGIFLYEVKPIEWIVVNPNSANFNVQNAGSGNYKMLVSKLIIDSNAFNYDPWKLTSQVSYKYNMIFDNSVVKAWLNGYESISVRCSYASDTYTDTFHQSNRTFMNLAFSNNKSDLKIFSHTTSSPAQVGLMSFSEADSNNVKEAYKTQYALASGDQDQYNDKYRWLIDDDQYAISRIDRSGNITWEKYSGSNNEYKILGVRPVICLDVSSFANSSKIGDIDSGDNLNIGQPLDLFEELDLNTTNYETPSLLHIQNEVVEGKAIDGSIVVRQKGNKTDDSYGTIFTIETSDITIGGEYAVTGYIVAGIRTYDVATTGSTVTKNIINTPNDYTKKFVPASTYLGGEDSVSSVTLNKLDGQFVMTFYLVFEGNVYLIPAEKITNPTIYTTLSKSESESNNPFTSAGRSPKHPVNLEVAKKLAGNDLDIGAGHMSTLYFSDSVDLAGIVDYQFKFKYPVVFNSPVTNNFAFRVADRKEITFENVTFDGENIERNNSFIIVEGGGKATFNNCVVKNALNVHKERKGGALIISENSAVFGSKLEISNCRATNGGGIYCRGTVDIEELILINNYSTASNSSASIYATTSSNGLTFNISKSLVVKDTDKVQNDGRDVYSPYAVYISNYAVHLQNPTFQNNKTFTTALYLENCSLLNGNSTLEGNGSFEGNTAFGESGCAGAMIVNSTGSYEYKFENIKFEGNNASSGGYGAVLVQGDYQGEKGVSFANCEFKDNKGLYVGGLAFSAFESSKHLAGNFKISNTKFFSNQSTSATTDIAGALLVKTEDSEMASFDLNGLIFNGNKSKFYGVANLILNSQSNADLQTITLGGEVQDGNQLDNIRNVSTGSGALFAIKGKTVGDKTSTVSINNFIAQNNQRLAEGTADNFANNGVLHLNNVKSTNGILISNSSFENNDGVSNGGALIVQNSSGIIQNSLFNNNKTKVSGESNSAVGGGAVYLSSLGKNEIEIKNSTFSGNKVLASGTGLFAGGGAILANGITLKLTDIYAKNNTVSGGEMIAKGGAICSYDNNSVGIEYLTKCQHSSPKLVISGGKFEANNASSKGLSQGGAIWGNCVQLTAGGTTAGYITTATTNGIAIFVNNKTLNGANEDNMVIKGDGGAIYTSSCFEILNEKNVNVVAQFTENFASNGGAVKACGVATIDGGEFASNVASTGLSNTIGKGGAMSFANSELAMQYESKDKYIGGQSGSKGLFYNLPMFAKIVRATFRENKANYGGAIYSDSVISNVGFAKYSMLNIAGSDNKVTFEKNVASSNEQFSIGYGGAIYATSPVSLDNISFSENKASLASVVYVDNSAKTYTQATSNYVLSDKITIENAIFNGNISGGSGVVSASNYVDITIKNSTFTANKNAGAILIFSKESGSLGNGTLENCSFSENINTSDVYSSDVIMVAGREVAINNCTFAQNGDTSKTGYGTAILVGKGNDGNGGLVYVNNAIINGTEGGKISHTNGFILVQQGGNLKVSGGSISYLENKDTKLGGGAVVVYGKASFDGVTISNCLAKNGGAIYVADGGDVSFAGKILNCEATSCGGGIYVENDATLLVSGKLKLDLTYSESLIKNNTATTGGGVFSLGDTTVEHASILENSATENGGGICAKENSSLTIAKDAIISGNKTTSDNRFGAGIYANNCYLSMSNAQISSNNVGNGVGGGLYATGVSFEAKDMIFSGNKATQGGAMFVGNGVAKLSYCTFTSNTSGTGGAVYLQKCSSSFVSCEFVGNSAQKTSQGGNKATGKGRAVLIDGGDVVLQNCTFKDNQTPANDSTAKIYAECNSLVVSSCNFSESSNGTTGGNVSHIYVKANNVEILDSNFTRGACAGENSGVTISAQNVWIERCRFVQNADGGLSLTADYGIIANSQFISNSNGGLKLNKRDNNTSSVEIIDSDFTNDSADDVAESNGNTSNSNGSAIYVAKDVNLRLSGEIDVSKNVVNVPNDSNVCGAIYVVEGGKLVITRGSKVVISDNIIHTSTANSASNLVFENWQDTAFLEGGLLDGSSIGITLITGNVVAQSPTNIPLETSDINKLFSDNANECFSYLANSKQLILYSKLDEPLKKLVTAKGSDNNTYAMTLSDLTLLYSGIKKDGYKIDKSYFEVTANGNKVDIASMKFSLKDGEKFQEEMTDSITLTSKGSYTIGFEVTAVKVGETVVEIDSNFLTNTGLVGEMVVDIVGEYLYVISTPQGVMTAKNASSFRITQAGLVQRSSGQEVAGIWGLVSPESVTKSGFYACKFTPKQTSLYENKDSVTSTMYVKVTYDKMYYINVAGTSKVYADKEGKTEIEATSFADAMEQLNDNGTIVFMTPYIASNGNETIAISKRINFVREKTGTNFAMFEVPDGQTLAITCTSGMAVFEGQNDETQYPVFVVEGKLVLGSNVTIRNFKCKSYASSSLHGIICNKGTLVLQGCKIYKNEITFEDSETSKIGGVVYNDGTMSILGGEFYDNRAINGNGGFVYTSGKLTVSGGTIRGNKSGYGAGVYVANDGSVVLSGGEITHNFAQNDGGGIYVANGGKLNLGGTQILSNIAGNLGAGLYKAEGGTVMLSSGEKVLTSTIESVEALNNVKEVKNDSKNNNWIVILCVIFMTIATAVFVLLLTKIKKLQTLDKRQ